VMAYREEGIIPEAFRNFLALLGWTPTDSTKELMPDQELTAAFSLDNISRSNAVFDRAKLDWFNTEYIRAYPAERLLPLIEDEWRREGITPERAHDRAWLLQTIDLLKPRARSLKDFATTFRGYFTDSFEHDPAAVEKFLKDGAVREMLGELAAHYQKLPDFTEQSAEQALRDLAAAKGVKAGVLINGARVALTGQAVAPSLFAVMAALGKDRTIARLQRATALSAPQLT
jgi:glutamyl-tRNA synthetase